MVYVHSILQADPGLSSERGEGHSMITKETQNNKKYMKDARSQEGVHPCPGSINPASEGHINSHVKVVHIS